MSDFDDLYRDLILDHAKRPRNRGKPPTANRTATGDNPTCGDNCTVHLRLDDGGRISAIGFEGSGCAISTASASIMTTQLKGKTAPEAEAAFAGLKDILATGKPPEDFNELAAFAGVHAFPARIKCATLAWHAALEAMKADPPPS
ncbi:MAG: SUF system NifU family Fe-S cluster assembly protein [Verrucomicrobiota bacterium]